MPIDYKKYPSNWKTLRELVLFRANNQCELCFLPNHLQIFRHKKTGEPLRFKDVFISEHKAYDMKDYKKVKIVLTIHHIDYNKENNHEKNLIALCQRCHLRLDEPLKRNNRIKKKYGCKTD